MQKSKIVNFMHKNTVIYDGSCGFCNRFILFIANNDDNNVFQFTSNDSSLAKDIFLQEGINPQLSDETIFIKTNNALYTKGKAIKEIFKRIPKYRVVYFGLKILNKDLIDFGYTIFSKIRKKIAPQTCEIPTKIILKKFI